jgi:hypothetical protein
MKNIQFLHIYTNIYLIFLLKNRPLGYSQEYRGINARSASGGIRSWLIPTLDMVIDPKT